MRRPPSFFRAGMRAFARFEAWRFRRSGGKARGPGGLPQLLLTTVGRTSGQERTVPLFFTRLDDRVVVIASYGGSDVPPAWWLNLQAAGRGRIEIGEETYDVAPTVLEGEEREQAWEAMAAQWPNYNEYVKKTTRRIPVIALARAE